MKHYLIITEKRHTLEKLLQSLAKNNLIGKDDVIDAMVSHGIGWWRYRIPRNLSMRDLPFTTVPGFSDLERHSIHDGYEPGLVRLDRPWYHIGGKNELEVAQADQPLAFIARRFDRYDGILAFFGDHRGWGSCEQIIVKLERELVNQGRPENAITTSPKFRPMMNDWGLDDKSILRAYERDTIWSDPVIQQHLAYYHRKRTFEYWWNTNSAAVFGACQIEAGQTKPRILSRNQVLLLHVIQRLGRATTLSQLYRGMSLWQGSGRYPAGQRTQALANDIAALALFDRHRDSSEDNRPSAYGPFGTATSCSTIIENLIDWGYLDGSKEGSMGQISEMPIAITAMGSRLVSLFHKHTYDPDLPFRLHEWCTHGNAAAMVKYIRTVFGTQKVLNGKRRAS